VPQLNKSRTILLSPDQDGIKKAVEFLKKDELVAFPTETVFGLGASALSTPGIEKIYAVKGRPTCNPLIVHIANPEDAFLWAKVPKIAQDIIDCFWPGPLTLVLPRKIKKNRNLSDLVTGNLNTIAIRVPVYPLARSLIKTYGAPIAAPSANISGKLSTTRAIDVLNSFNGQISSIIDDKPCSIGLESTIIGFEQGTPVLLRPGGITVEELKERLNLSVSPPKFDKKARKKILAPGMLESHYAPQTQLRLNVKSPKPDELFLGFGEMPRVYNGLCLSKSFDLTEAAANLFAALADLDLMANTMKKNAIAVAPIPNFGLGRAINDRLKRASVKKVQADPPKVAK